MLPEIGLSFSSGIIQRKFAERWTALRKEVCERHRDISIFLQIYKGKYNSFWSEFLDLKTFTQEFEYQEGEQISY